MADLQRLGLNPQRLTGFAPALRCLVQSLQREHGIARRIDHLLDAEDWRRCRNVAGALLQGVEDQR